MNTKEVRQRIASDEFRAPEVTGIEVPSTQRVLVGALVGIMIYAAFPLYEKSLQRALAVFSPSESPRTDFPAPRSLVAVESHQSAPQALPTIIVK